jgi:L-aminopeptidase/D-esterase-like protein
VITDIPGQRVEHRTDPIGPTGCTLIMCPNVSNVVAEAIRRGVRAATGVPGYPAASEVAS